MKKVLTAQCGKAVLYRQHTIASGGAYCDYFITENRESRMS
ncbi:MAG: hypothetical protein ACLUR9_07755 [Christensenellales bacterium]